MRILATEENLIKPLGGGEISLKTLLCFLKEKNEVLAVAKHVKGTHIHPSSISSINVFEIPRTHMFNKYLVFKQLEPAIKRVIKKFSPHLVITQQDFAAPTLKMAYKAGVPSVFFIRNYEHLCLCDSPMAKCNRECAECYGYHFLNPYRYFVDAVFRYEREWISKAYIVVSNSYYMSKTVKEWYNINSPVIYPFVHAFKIEKRHPEYITFINPSRHKGLYIFLKIAERLPKKRFLVVGHNTEAINFSKYENIKYVPWVDDPSIIYSQTKLLLVPSIWPEPFGRICVEAGFNGIPSVASNIGGLPEAVGDGGILIDLYEDPENWVDAIAMLDDDRVYEAYSERAKIFSKKFGMQKTFKEFKELVEHKLDLWV